MPRRKSYSILLMFPLILSGCISTPIRSMINPIIQNSEYLNETTASAHNNEIMRWWEHYNDAELNNMIETAFIDNPNINQMRARIMQARASATKIGAPRLPSLNISGQSNKSNGNNLNGSDISLDGAASFELDLFGKNKANQKSSSLEAQATQEDLHAAAITLSASITQNWLNILSLLEQETLARKQIDVNQTILKLQQKRFEMGLSTALDILQQEEILASSLVQIPDIMAAQKQAVNEIALLVGTTPRQSLKITSKPFPDPLNIPQAGLPSQLIGKRPDITAAWLRLISSDWAVHGAWADRMPKFDLTANYITSAGAINGLFNTWLLNMIAGVSAPIFDGGSRKAEELRRRAISDENTHTYRQAILSAVVEVENSLARNMHQDQKMVALDKQFEAAHKTLKQAQVSYTNGKSDYINVLDSLNKTQSLEQKIVREKLVQAQMRVTLYRSLGGRHWNTKSPNAEEGK